MTVKELIDKLKTLDEDKEIFTYSHPYMLPPDDITLEDDYYVIE
jgi:hypothetical protein